MFAGGVLCNPICGGRTPCLASCNSANKTWTETETFGGDASKTTFSEVTGMELNEEEGRGNIEYSKRLPMNDLKFPRIYFASVLRLF